MTSLPHHDDPPRRPLRVRVEVRGQLGDGSSIVATAWRTLEPEEPEYEQAYQEAARAHRISGWEMPYAGRLQRSV